MTTRSLITIPTREVQPGDTLVKEAGHEAGIPLLITAVSSPVCGLISVAYTVGDMSGHRILIDGQHATVERPDQEEAH